MFTLIVVKKFKSLKVIRKKWYTGKNCVCSVKQIFRLSLKRVFLYMYSVVNLMQTLINAFDKRDFKSF